MLTAWLSIGKSAEAEDKQQTHGKNETKDMMGQQESGHYEGLSSGITDALTDNVSSNYSLCKVASGWRCRTSQSREVGLVAVTWLSFPTFGVFTNCPGTNSLGDQVNAVLHRDGSQNSNCYESKMFQSSLTQLS